MSGSIKITRGGAEATQEEGQVVVRWKQRQRMAWLSLIAMLIFTLMEWFALPVYFKYMEIPTNEWTTMISSTSDWMYITLGTVVIGYMGSTAWMMRGKNVTVKDKDY